tara:strand:- start:1503 stop:1943 length:441 start_codon:yes stop_codon:yes gene_type:complete
MVSNKDITIFLLINQKVKLNEISGKILFFKNSMEEKDNQIYYDGIYENIVGSYFKCLEDRYPTYSYVLNDREYIAKKDKNDMFFKKTGISYQVRDLVINLISEYKDDTITEDEKKEWRKEDDLKYSKLANKIHKIMKSKDYPQLVS